MRAYYYDDIPGDQRLPHDSHVPVSPSTLERVGLLYWHVPVSPDGEIPSAVNEVATQRGYKNRDVITVSREGLGEQYEAKIKNFFEEHLHEDEEIRYILQGSGYFDVREHAPSVSEERWIRLAMEPGDLVVLPSGVYHRFTLDTKDRVQALRLFKDEPKWIAHNRNEQTDANPYRAEYLKAVTV